MIKEPIYGSVLSLKIDDAWNKILAFSEDYPIKKKDKDNYLIVLNIGYPIRMFTYFTWAEGIVISLKPLGDNTTMLNIYGKVLLSPHHIFRSITLNKKKIDKSAFLSNAKTSFKQFETKKPVAADLWKKREFIFLFLLVFSVVSFLSILIHLFLLNMPNNSLIVTISSLLFMISQAILIIWFTRDCYSRDNLTVRERSKWITYICLTGFIGCFLYYSWGPWKKFRDIL